ncbi:MAG: multicopper oxidase domain-containing protein [Gammaproteobacteria bacterium]|nr:multicopper oxidase domain-containing protein [Gammaproteobacteria bacterium]
MYAYNGSVPGPALRIGRGRTLRVRLKNRLDVDTTVHWHGIRIANAMDGVPELTQDPVAPGAEFEYEFAVPDAGTYWYHSHRFSFEQVERGLYGLLIVDEEQPYPVDRDIPLVVDDWRLTGDGAIDPSFGDLHDVSHAGRLGNWITVNGASLPDIDVATGERVRLRVANTANARIVTLHLRDLAPWVIALDGQPVAPFVLTGGKLTLAPGQRTDLVVDIATPPGARTPIDLVDPRGVLTIAHLSARGDTGTARNGPPPPCPPIRSTRTSTSAPRFAPS